MPSNRPSESTLQQQHPLVVAEKGRGLQLRSIEQMHRFCQFAVASRYLPKHITNVEQAVMIVEMGAEVGLGPWTALKHIAVINGLPSIWGDAALGLCQASEHWEPAGHEEGWIKGATEEDHGAYCVVQRKGGDPYRAEFTVRDAKRAGLWDDPKKRDTWGKYPKDMLLWRARHRALKACFADVLLGLAVVSPQEFQAEVIDAGPALPPPPPPLPDVTGRTPQDAINEALADLPPSEAKEDGKTQQAQKEVPPAKPEKVKAAAAATK